MGLRMRVPGGLRPVSWRRRVRIPGIPPKTGESDCEARDPVNSRQCVEDEILISLSCSSSQEEASVGSTTLIASSSDVTAAEPAREYVKQHPGFSLTLPRVRRDEQAFSWD